MVGRMNTRKPSPERRPEKSPAVAVVKKYANRRLYNTATSSYVTLDELSQMVRRGEDFVVYDAKTNEDITRSVLTQIILEEDSKGRNLLPISFLRQVIGFYDDQLHAFLPRYLELSMENFARNQEQMRAYMGETFGRFFPLAQFEDMTRQNVALFQRAATSMFRPFQAENGEAGAMVPLGPDAPRPPESSGEGRAAPEAGAGGDLPGQMRDLESRVELLQRQLEALSQNAKAPVG